MALAWCPTLSAHNHSSQHSLAIKEEFRCEDGFHRLSWATEPIKERKNKGKKAQERKTKKTGANVLPDSGYASSISPPKSLPKSLPRGNKRNQIEPDSEHNVVNGASEKMVQDDGSSAPQTTSRPKHNRRTPKWMNQDGNEDAQDEEMQDQGLKLPN